MTVRSRKRSVAHFEASIRKFADAVSAGRARTAHLTGGSNDLVQDPETLRIVLDELRAHQEELGVAEEELRVQLEELTETSARLHRERDRYQELFDAAPDAYFVSDRAAVVRSVNAAGAKMLAIEPRCLDGKPLAAFVDAADVHAMRDAIDELRTTQTIEIEVRLRPRGAEPAWHGIRATNIESGTAILWIARSVHVRRAASEALLDAHEESGAVANARIAGLTRASRDKDDLLARERRLRARLEEAHVATDRFLAVLSHDLRAPLNAVLGWTQLLRREKLDEAARDRALATIERNAHAQLRLVEELLDLSRITAQKQQLERQPLDLGELVDRAAGAIALAAREREIELSVVRSDETCIVSGERRRLEQIVTSLLSNAVKFTPAGGRVTVSLAREERNARIQVEDTGRGIASALLPHVFEPLRHAADYTTAGQGVGLGLYIARQAVEMHGGEIVAASEGPGRGSRFTVVLPLATTPSDAPPSDARSLPASDALQGVRVLVVDDEDDALELMGTVLRQRGALVTTARDVPTALLAFDASPVDVVVSDIAMPGSGGLDLVRALRSRKDRSASYVAVSGFAASEEVERALAAGFDVHLAKPVDPSELIAVVRDASRGRSR